MGDMKLSKNRFGVFVGGSWFDGGEKAEIHSPFDQTVVATVARTTRKQLDEAISAAVKAFEVTRNMASYERRRVLDRVATELSSRKDDFANAICLEAGKP